MSIDFWFGGFIPRAAPKTHNSPEEMAKDTERYLTPYPDWIDTPT